MSFSWISTCPACGTGNRVPPGHLSDTGKCGACKASLPPTHLPIPATAETFDQIIAAAKVPVLVDFWAEWCGPCKMIAPELHALAQEMAGRALVLKVDTEQYPELAARFNVQAIPNFVVLQAGRVVRQHPGLAPAADMRAWLESAAPGR